MVSYKNIYNNEIKGKLNQINENKIDHEERMDAAPHQFEVVSPLEAATMHNANINGGSAYVSSSVQDLGFDPTKTQGEIKNTKRIPSKRGAGMTAAGLTAAGHTMVGTDPATYQPMVLGQESWEVGGALLSVKDFYNVHGNPIPASNEDPEVIRRNQPIRKVARKAKPTEQQEVNSSVEVKAEPPQTEGFEGAGKREQIKELRS